MRRLVVYRDKIMLAFRRFFLPGLLSLICGLSIFTSPIFAQQGTFVLTGSMGSPRSGHTATLLSNGAVLIAGGQNDTTTLDTAELYNLVTGAFTPTGNLNVARTGHTATLLNNGTVLIVGGDGYGGGTAELYNPGSGTFTITGSLNTPRGGHAATLLNNGTVLIAGGQDANGFVAMAELYDPATGTFSYTGSLNTGRIDHTATRLSNGQVLLAGTFEGTGEFSPTAELFDPLTGTFSYTGSMNTARCLHTATLLNDGTVLIAGGAGNISGNASDLASAELYDPINGTFNYTGTMSSPRQNHSATLLNNGAVLIAGGDTLALLGSAELYAPASGTFTLTGGLNTARASHTATLLNNATVLIAGGYNEVSGELNVLATAEVYEQVGISPASLSFPGEVEGTTSAPQTVTLTNNQSTPVTITGVAISGTNASDFGESDNCVTSLPAGGSCSISVSFAPIASGTLTALVALENNLSAGPMQVPLTGTGIAATRIASLSASTLTFPNVMVGATGALSFTLGNTGNSVLTLSGIAMSGANASDFAETDNCAGSVAAGASCTINVTFAPTATGTRSATLNITDNATSPQSPQTVALIGTGIPAAPIVSLSSTSVVFGNQQLGAVSGAQAVTLRNTGAATLNIQTVALTGVNPGDFAIANGSTCAAGTAVPANSTCVIQITFSPTGLGSRSAAVSITDNAADSPELISLSGTTTPTPLIVVSPTNITFGSQFVGTSGLPQSVTVTNNGNAPLNITSVAVSANDFATLNACGSSLAAGASCAIGVFFDPTVSGARTGTLTVSDSAPSSPQTVALSGTGQDFALTAQSTTATIAAGQTATYSVSVSPGGGFNQSVTFACTGAPSLSTCNASPPSVALNGSTASSVTVMVATTAPAIAFPDAQNPGAQDRNPRVLLLALCCLLLLLVLSQFVSRSRRSRASLASVSLLALTVFLGLSLPGCQGGSNAAIVTKPGTPAGTYSLILTATFSSGSTNLSHNTTLTLVVQ